MTWKQVECPFEEDRAILHYLHTAPIFSEDGENLFLTFESSLHMLIKVFVCDGLFLLTNINSVYLLSSPGLYLASYESESPENQGEKDRWKALR